MAKFLIKLDFHIRKTNIGGKKINSNKLKIFEKVITFFLQITKSKKYRFLEKTFLLTNISIDIAFEILFFILNNVEINFNN